MDRARSSHDGREPAQPPVETAPPAEKPAAWAMIAAGRYQPRRIRGSLLGRELG
jgi:hypothetical protein